MLGLGGAILALTNIVLGLAFIVGTYL